MPNRQVTEHFELGEDREILQVVTVFETKISRKRAARIVPYSRQHKTMIEKQGKYNYVESVEKC